MLVWDSQPATHVHTSPKGCAQGCSGNLSFDQWLANIQLLDCLSFLSIQEYVLVIVVPVIHFCICRRKSQIKDLEKCNQDYISGRDSEKQKESI